MLLFLMNYSSPSITFIQFLLTLLSGSAYHKNSNILNGMFML